MLTRPVAAVKFDVSSTPEQGARQLLRVPVEG